MKISDAIRKRLKGTSIEHSEEILLCLRGIVEPKIFSEVLERLLCEIETDFRDKRPDHPCMDEIVKTLARAETEIERDQTDFRIVLRAVENLTYSIGDVKLDTPLHGPGCIPLDSKLALKTLEIIGRVCGEKPEPVAA